MVKDTIMNTRQSSISTLCMYNRKIDPKATYSEILGDLKQLADTDIKIILTKKPRNFPYSPASPPKRQKIRKDPKIKLFGSEIPDDASAILGFASFLTESEAQSQTAVLSKLPIMSPKQEPKPKTIIMKPSKICSKLSKTVQPTPKRLAALSFPRSASHLAMAYFIKNSIKC